MRFMAGLAAFAVAAIAVGAVGEARERPRLFQRQQATPLATALARLAARFAG